MALDRERVRSMAQLIGFDIPEAELEPIAIRLSELLSAMDEIEQELGAEMDRVDPVPPVFPREDW
jgi:Asp-tRNA(Asn)/Glu-tRNA(Gln) amidotransferase C subunit